MPKYLIVNTDDFGVSTGVNRGILECHTRGVVTSASLMVYRSAVRDAVAIGRDHPALALGLHWDPGPDGEEIDLANHQLVSDHFRRQVDQFYRLVGHLPTHVDSEAHTHQDEDLMPLFRELTRPLGVPLRSDGRVRFVGAFYAQWYYEVTNLKYVSVPFLVNLLRDEASEGWTEFSCHPGYISPDLDSTYNFEREAEVRTLTDPRIRQTIEELGIRLVSYADYQAINAAVLQS